MSDFKLTPAREKELEKIARDLPDKSFKDLYGKDWKSVKIATAMNILKKKYGFKTEETKMKFKEIREKVRGGKLDPLSKMGGSKLTGAEISRYYKDNPMAKRAARDATVKKAIELALDLGGSMNYAMKEIEKLKRGLSKNKEVAKALRFANESVNKEAASPEEKAQLALKHAKEKEQLQKKQATEKERLANESVISEGTWNIPDNRRELAVLVDMLKTPYVATSQKDIDKFLNMFPVGDDSLYDDIDEVMYEKEADGSLKRPLVRMRRFKKVFLNVIAGESLVDERWIKGKTVGNKFIMTHHSFGPNASMESVKEAMPKRKSGNIKKAKMMKMENIQEGFLDRANVKVLADVPDPKTGLPIFFILQDNDGIKIVVDRDVTKGTAGSISRGEKVGDYEFTGFADYLAMNPGHFKKFMRAIKKVRV